MNFSGLNVLITGDQAFFTEEALLNIAEMAIVNVKFAASRPAREVAVEKIAPRPPLA